MKIVTVVGARPQFIKAAAVSRLLREKHQEILVHTGQHYDKNMSDVFFEELSIPTPDYNLEIGSGSHAVQTAGMLVGIEKVLLDEKPDLLLVYGDTNSTLAGALAAGKLHIPVAHVEAGMRSFNMRMPEEQNRVLTDHISTLLFCATQAAVGYLKNEGRAEGVYFVGDVMCDAVLRYAGELKDVEYYWRRLRPLLEGPLPAMPAEWYLATVHRAENTDTPEKVKEILGAFEELPAPVIFPVHPRTKSFVDALQKEHGYKNIIFVQPVGYLDMLFFTKNAKKVITDSGGLQKECYVLQTPCVTVRDQTEWTETLAGGFNVLSKPAKADIIAKVFFEGYDWSNSVDFYGGGKAAARVCEKLAD